MGKPKPPRGFYRESVHDGSSVTSSQLRPAPGDGMGNHTKSVGQRIKRHTFFKLVREATRHGQREAIPNILELYRREIKTRRI